MSITVYTAPDCLRCTIVKAFLDEKGAPYATVDFTEQKSEFNAFYRENRGRIYRNAEGVEFPLFSDGVVVKQGSGEIIAHLLAGAEMEGCVVRSDLLHGWISGLYPSLCPPDRENDFVELVRRLAEGGLRVYIQADGRNPAFLERLIQSGFVSRLCLNILGPAAYETSFGGPLAPEDLAKSVELVRGFSKGRIRLLIGPTMREDGRRTWTAKEEAAAAAKMTAAACGNSLSPIFLAAVVADMSPGLQGLEPFDQSLLLSYRSACRKFLFKIDIAKAE